jgi:hypothetical protein
MSVVLPILLVEMSFRSIKKAFSEPVVRTANSEPFAYNNGPRRALGEIITPGAVERSAEALERIRDQSQAAGATGEAASA